ncbi:hypothetical protein RHGRI_035762 [Rhododendron griersonianum]|uniref:Uncharacterized protein n=1 Tax=Rhododendron griersonianum TaxID=479676 RepID=A0AAV6HQQ8_9ERIC|nr:hypothetical protein RHGRI_035762 [Rhododendron griersonianum]
MISRRRRREFSGSSSGQVVLASAAVWWETSKENCISMSGWPFIGDQSKGFMSLSLSLSTIYLLIGGKVKFGPESSLIKKCFGYVYPAVDY